MANYRLKRVGKDGSLAFYNFDELKTKESAFKRASMMCILPSIDHVDVYFDSKLIATFYK